MLMVSLGQIRVPASRPPSRAGESVIFSQVGRRRHVFIWSLAIVLMAPLGGCGGMATGPCQRAYEPIEFRGAPTASDVLEFAVAVAYVVLRIVVPESYSHCHGSGSH